MAGDLGERLDLDAAMVRLSRLSSCEALYEPRPDYITEVQQDGMNETWREKIVTWFNQLGENFMMSSETLSVATNYLDRYLSLKSVGSVNFQLVSIASIFLASKVEEPKPFRTSDFVAMSDKIFSASDLRLMELELLCTLKWHLHPPTVTEFVHLLLLIFDDDDDDDGEQCVSSSRQYLNMEPSERQQQIAEHALRYADLTRIDSDFLKYPTSMIAVASVICALKQVGVPMTVVSNWMSRVQGCKLSYIERPDAAAAITACGLKLIGLDGGDYSMFTQACDAEVESALMSDDSENNADLQQQQQQQQTPTTPSSCSSLENELTAEEAINRNRNGKASNRDMNSHSPNDVMDIEEIIGNFEDEEPPKFDPQGDDDHRQSQHRRTAAVAAAPSSSSSSSQLY